jgi:serine/threonine protein phosphatase PrpC
MIVSSISGRGGRLENLDCIINFQSRNGSRAVLVVDAYGCKQCDVERFTVMMEGFDFDGVSSASDLLARIDVDFNIKMSVVCIAKINSVVSLSSIGDCRAYSESGELLTLDHTSAWDDLFARGIEPTRIAELVKIHPGRRVLTRFLKFPKPLHVAEEVIINCSDEKKYLLCSDGFWEHFSHSNLADLTSGVLSVEEVYNTLSSASDNYTACIVRF